MQRVEGGFEPTSVVQPPRRWRVLQAAFALSAALVVVAVCTARFVVHQVSCSQVLLTGVRAAAEEA